MREMKIIHVITGMQKAAGTTTFVENVVTGLREMGHEVRIAMSKNEFEPCDVMHIHGLWSRLLHEAAVYARAHKIPIVWSTHGMTAPWAMRHKIWKKIPAWLLYQKSDLRKATAIHCTTDQEAKWNHRLGFENCFVAPLGTNETIGSCTESKKGGRSRLLFVGRIYPVKGLVNLIKAWDLVLKSNAQIGKHWILRIVGPDQAGHKAELERLSRKLDIWRSIEFVGPLYGEDLSREYDSCDCLVLPSFTENFGGVIVDALAHGKPCIASSFTPWEELNERECGWFVSNEPENLAKAIRLMMNLSGTARKKFGERGIELVKEKYMWGAVVSRINNFYNSIIVKGA